MKKSVLDRIAARLMAVGIQTDSGAIYRSTADDAEPVPVLIARHNYNGPYPTRETWQTIETVRRICKRYNVALDMRGYYQATYIREEVTPE